MTDTQELTAKWIDDGFFHPPHQVATEFVDVDEFVRVPLRGIPDAVQFSRIRLRSEELGRVTDVVVVGPNAGGSEVPLSEICRSRYPGASLVFLESASPGRVVASPAGDALGAFEAGASAITNYRLDWDESPEFRVQRGAVRFDVGVSYSDDSYGLIVRGPLATQ